MIMTDSCGTVHHVKMNSVCLTSPVWGVLQGVVGGAFEAPVGLGLYRPIPGSLLVRPEIGRLIHVLLNTK